MDLVPFAGSHFEDKSVRLRSRSVTEKKPEPIHPSTRRLRHIGATQQGDVIETKLAKGLYITVHMYFSSRSLVMVGHRQDAEAWLSILQQLTNLNWHGCPKFCCSWSFQDYLCIRLSYAVGQRASTRYPCRSEMLHDDDDYFSFAHKLARLLRRLHELGIALGNLSLENILVRPSNELLFLDWRCSSRFLDHVEPAARILKSTSSIERRAMARARLRTRSRVVVSRQGRPVTEMQDVRDYGVCVYRAVMGFAPPPGSLSETNARELCSRLPGSLPKVVARCLSVADSTSPITMAQVDRLLGSPLAVDWPGKFASNHEKYLARMQDEPGVEIRQALAQWGLCELPQVRARMSTSSDDRTAAQRSPVLHLQRALPSASRSRTLDSFDHRQVAGSSGHLSFSNAQLWGFPPR